MLTIIFTFVPICVCVRLFAHVRVYISVHVYIYGVANFCGSPYFLRLQYKKYT